MDRWVYEGLSGFGSLRRSLQAGVWAGAALPWLFALLAIVYGQINNFFAPASSRLWISPGYVWELILLYGVRLMGSTLLFAALGGLFAYLRYVLLRARVHVEDSSVPWLAFLCDSRAAGVIMGWTFYALWALMPRFGGGINFSGALHYPWIWLFFGILFSMYYHWAQSNVLYRLYYRDWTAGCKAVALRLLRGTLHIADAGPVEADPRTGHVAIFNFPKGKGKERLNDLVLRIPGVSGVTINEVGQARLPERELITLHVPDGERSHPPLITLARTMFAVGGLSGLAVYVFGLSYALTQGKFMVWSNFIVVLALQVEAVGLVIGYVARYLLVRRAQKDLPRQLERALHFVGKDLHGFSFGSSWEEARLVADLSRSEAKETLLPVAARFGLLRLLVEAPFDSRR